MIFILALGEILLIFLWRTMSFHWVAGKVRNSTGRLIWEFRCAVTFHRRSNRRDIINHQEQIQISRLCDGSDYVHVKHIYLLHIQGTTMQTNRSITDGFTSINCSPQLHSRGISNFKQYIVRGRTPPSYRLSRLHVRERRCPTNWNLTLASTFVVLENS